MERICFLAVIFVTLFSASQCLLEADTLSSMVATLQLTVQDLQGQVRALQNNSCGKILADRSKAGS